MLSVRDYIAMSAGGTTDHGTGSQNLNSEEVESQTDGRYNPVIVDDERELEVAVKLSAESDSLYSTPTEGNLNGTGKFGKLVPRPNPVHSSTPMSNNELNPETDNSMMDWAQTQNRRKFDQLSPDLQVVNNYR